jgi:diguanylate cyclase (GGDEF)-like protein
MNFFKMNKIRNKILVSIIGCVLIMSLIVGSVIVVQNAISIRKEAMISIKSQAIVNGKQINNKFVRAKTIVGGLNSTIEQLVDVNKLRSTPSEYEETLVPIINKLNNTNINFMGIYVAFNPDITKDVHEIFFEDIHDNCVYTRLKNDSLSDFNPNNPAMAWYYNAIKNKKGVWSDPYFDQLDEKVKVEMISYSEPVYKDGILIAVVGIDLNFNKFVNIVNHIKDPEGGYTFLLNDNYNYIVHKKFTSKDNLKEIEGGKYKYMADAINKDESGCLEVEFDGEKKLIGYTHLSNEWILVTSIPQKIIYSNMQAGIIYALIAIMIGLVLSSHIAVQISRKISEPVILATHFAEELAMGNLDEKLYITSSDETATLGKSLNKAGENISILIGELKSTEEKLIYQIEELRKSEDTISALAYNHPVTGFRNRNYLLKNMPTLLNKLKDNNQEGALFLINIDNFKIINDTLGHSVGDEFLRKASKILTNLLRPNTLLFHLGADEFTFFFPDINSLSDLEDLSKKLLNVFRHSITANGYEILYTTISLGISLYPSHGNDIESLFKNADIALNDAKNRGKNTYKIFDETMNLEISKKLQLENMLRQAVDNDEFQVYYQPKVNVKTGKTTSMEALVRWISPTLGFVSPVEFIPLAEETGLIHRIGEFVLRESCRQNKIWHEQGFNTLKVAVNLSGKQLKQNNLISIINNILKETSLDPKWLELEITESILMDNFDKNIIILSKLKEMGINIYLDDFGTGYSSLNYLRKLPINFIKIDKSFIDEITINSKDSFIASSLIALAHGIDLRVVAEGVETSEQLNLLKSYDCDEIQGYYFSKPLNSSDFGIFLNTNGLRYGV